MKILIISFFFMVVLMVEACGMQGDLYLPEEEVKADDATTDEMPQEPMQDITQKTNESY